MHKISGLSHKISGLSLVRFFVIFLIEVACAQTIFCFSTHHVHGNANSSHPSCVTY